MKYILLSFNPSIKTLKNFSSDAVEIFTALTIISFLMQGVQLQERFSPNMGLISKAKLKCPAIATVLLLKYVWLILLCYLYGSHPVVLITK
jgi:hypothetical protein